MKAKTKKVNDPVGEYLVKRINELEEQLETESRVETNLLCQISNLEEKSNKFEELKSLFSLENSVVCLYDKGGHFQVAIASDFIEFGKYLTELLELKEKQ